MANSGQDNFHLLKIVIPVGGIWAERHSTPILRNGILRTFIEDNMNLFCPGKR